MARPKKQSVDYFPHSCTHGKTIFILETQFGNDGYSFWFKLLEILGNSNGHYASYNGDGANDWEYLKAKVKLSDEKCTDILNLLSKLGAIDTDLWKRRVVWSQNFTDGISDVYVKRKTETPTKPNYGNPKPQTVDVSVTETPQSKVEETKVEEIKEDKIIIYPFDSKKFMDKWELWKKYRLEIGKKPYKKIGEQSALTNLYNLSILWARKTHSVKCDNSNLIHNAQAFFNLESRDFSEGSRILSPRPRTT